MIYFDHNATTLCDERVVEAMLPYLKHLYGNPSSLYKLGRIARSAIDTAREQLAALVDASPAQIIFTSGGTEANALAIRNAHGKKLAISAIEHPSIFENARLNRHNFTDLLTIGVNQQGVIPATALDSLKQLDNGFVSLMLANNETGAVQDIAGIVLQLADRSITVHTDAVQALGKIPLSFRQLGVHMMSLSSHKIYGPKGCGALIVDDRQGFQALQPGGDQENSHRGGTENVAAIVGFGKAAELARLEFDQRREKLQGLQQHLQQQLRQIPKLVIFADQVERLPNTVQFAIPNCHGEMLLMQLDQHNIAVSSGSACATGSDDISPVLAAMEVEPELAKAAIRISLGKDNNLQEIDQFVGILKTLINQQQTRLP